MPRVTVLENAPSALPIAMTSWPGRTFAVDPRRRTRCCAFGAAHLKHREIDRDRRRDDTSRVLVPPAYSCTDDCPLITCSLVTTDVGTHEETGAARIAGVDRRNGRKRGADHVFD